MGQLLHPPEKYFRRRPRPRLKSSTRPSNSYLSSEYTHSRFRPISCINQASNCLQTPRLSSSQRSTMRTPQNLLRRSGIYSRRRPSRIKRHEERAEEQFQLQLLEGAKVSYHIPTEKRLSPSTARLHRSTTSGHRLRLVRCLALVRANSLGHPVYHPIRGH